MDADRQPPTVHVPEGVVNAFGASQTRYRPFFAGKVTIMANNGTAGMPMVFVQLRTDPSTCLDPVSPPTGTTCTKCTGTSCTCSCDAGYSGRPSATCTGRGWAYVHCEPVPPRSSPSSGASGCTLCLRPSNFCTHAGARYSNVDCDGDGCLDHACWDPTDRWGVVSSRANCSNNWPTALHGGHDVDNTLPRLIYRYEYDIAGLCLAQKPCTLHCCTAALPVLHVHVRVQTK